MSDVMSAGYDRQFFNDQRTQALRSARQVVPLLIDWFQPRSVIDIGCGGGAWLSVFSEHGLAETLGIDGAWASGFHDLAAGTFLQHDLTEPLSVGRRFDLCISLEVAEHLPADRAARFVQSLTGLSSVVVFSAAVPLQGGTHHVNEQWPDYWEELFRAVGYELVDCVRPEIWNNLDVEWWYAQNTFVYVDSQDAGARARAHAIPLRMTLPRRIVHPRNYLEKARLAQIGLAELLKMAPELARDAVGRRIRKLGSQLSLAAFRR